MTTFTPATKTGKPYLTLAPDAGCKQDNTPTIAPNSPVTKE